MWHVHCWMTCSMLQALHCKLRRLSSLWLHMSPVGCSAGSAGLCLSAQRGLQAQCRGSARTQPVDAVMIGTDPRMASLQPRQAQQPETAEQMLGGHHLAVATRHTMQHVGLHSNDVHVKASCGDGSSSKASHLHIVDGAYRVVACSGLGMHGRQVHFQGIFPYAAPKGSARLSALP